MTERRPYEEPTAALARFAANLDTDGIPTEVTGNVKRLLLDALAAAYTGWTSDQSHQVQDGAGRLFGPGTSTVIGGGALSPGGATLVNSYLVTARSFCDVHQPTLAHITPVVVPPMLTAAERVGASGSSLVTALAVAMESMVRVGLGLIYPVFRSRGWHTPGVAGPIGGALGLASLLGFDADQAERAAGIGGSQAAGTFASFGTPTIKLHQARAAWSALMATDMVAAGFEGPRSILSHQDGGVFNTYSDGGDPIAVTEELGTRWELQNITTRLWPTAAALQAVIAMVLLDRPDLVGGSDIRRVTVGLPPASYEMNADMGWDTSFQAVLSARYVTAVVLSEGECRIDQFAPDRLFDPPGIVESIDVVLDPTLPEGGATLRIAAGSETIDMRREHPKGSPADPATWDEVVGKFRTTARSRLADDVIRRVVDDVAELENVDDVGDLVGRLAGR